MRVPVLRGVLERRILVNYRVDPDALARLLPPPFRPELVRGYGIAGVCLIRLAGVRPRWIPGALGLSSENAAHRIAVEWDGGRGVFVARRDTDSRLGVLAGGRLFPGAHHRARFDVDETDERLAVALESADGSERVRVVAHRVSEWPGSRLFDSLAEVSAFFERGSLGWSPARAAARFEALELCCVDWRVEPLALERVESSFFDDRTRFPAGAAELDGALLMRGVEHEWRAHPAMEAP